AADVASMASKISPSAEKHKRLAIDMVLDSPSGSRPSRTETREISFEYKRSNVLPASADCLGGVTDMSTTPRILVLSASVGAGHLRAAQAVELALREVVPAATVRNVDVLGLTNTAFRRLYGKLYLELVNKAPHVLGYFYDLLDQPSRSGRNRSDRLRLAVEKLNLRRFIHFLKSEPWDLVLNTHFLPSDVHAPLARQAG